MCATTTTPAEFDEFYKYIIVSLVSGGKCNIYVINENGSRMNEQKKKEKKERTLAEKRKT